MRKLIKVINSKIINKKKSSEKQIKSQKYLSFNFRREKLSSKVSLKSFPNTIQSPNLNLLAVSNFQGTQFVVKSVPQSSIGTQDQKFSQIKFSKQIQNIQKVQKVQTEREMEKRFRQLIVQINEIIRDLFNHKKKLLQQSPFSKNINLILGILLIFTIGLGSFTLYDRSQAISHGNQDSQSFSFLIFGFLLILIIMGLINVFYVVKQPYKFFNFDYEVMSQVTKRLMEQNQQYFKKRRYKLVCDIEVTWILLKPFGNDNNLLENQSDKL